MPERVGVVGLGIMGFRMARNLLRAGFPVSVTNRTIARAEPLRADGATVCATPKEVASQSDLVISMVTTSSDVEAVRFGDDGIADGAHPGLLAVDMSTISPDVAKDVARRAAERGFRTLDAPVSGGEIGAIEARLTIMSGGAGSRPREDARSHRQRRRRILGDGELRAEDPVRRLLARLHGRPPAEGPAARARCGLRDEDVAPRDGAHAHPLHPAPAGRRRTRGEPLAHQGDREALGRRG